MRFIVLFGFGSPLAVATIVEVGRGNPFAIGIALGLVGPAVYFATVALLTRAATPPPRKADPARIARLERELLDEPPEPPASEAPTGKLPMVRYEGTMREAIAIRRIATFHGAPTFGHKIEGP